MGDICGDPYSLPFNQVGFIEEREFVLQISQVIVNSPSLKG